MNALEKENLTYNLARRMILLEELTAALATAGILHRQIVAIDEKLSRSFKSLITFPAEFTPAGFRQAVTSEFDFQVTTGSPLRESFQAAMESPRLDLVAIMQQVHTGLLAGISAAPKGE